MDDFDPVVQKRGVVDPGGSLKYVDIPPGRLGGVVDAAQSQLGKPYVFGSGPDTKSFDCSDLIQWAYKQVGINLPRVTYDQIRAGRSVKGQKLRPGDLVFPSRGHVVMYVGNGKVIAAPHTGAVVQMQDLSSFGNLVDVRRITK
ncbi:MAG: C40 family peptidase [Chloroflexi bacterium]|nr:C40 family peptidase [Chloroflexota bacterium]